MPHKTINAYPSLNEEVELPIYMRAVGCNDALTQINRPEGYIYHQIFFIENGSLTLDLPDSKHTLIAGKGFFIKKGLPYVMQSVSSPCKVHWVSFGCNCEEMLFKKIGLNNYFIYEQVNVDEMKMLLKKMYLLANEDHFYSSCQNSANVYQFIMEMYAMQEKVIENKPEEANPAFLLAKGYIEQYYFTDLKLDTLAEFAHVSPQHLCRLFQKYLNMRPSKYINLTRIKVAKWRLHATDMTITEIADEVGYSTPYYFTNTFKKYEHMSPSEYRKMVKGS